MKLIMLAFALSLSACTHTYVRGWTADTVTTCCPGECGREHLENAAVKECGGAVKKVSGEIVGMRGRKDSCVTYQCEGGKHPASAK